MPLHAQELAQAAYRHLDLIAPFVGTEVQHLAEEACGAVLDQFRALDVIIAATVELPKVLRTYGVFSLTA